MGKSLSSWLLRAEASESNSGFPLLHFFYGPWAIQSVTPCHNHSFYEVRVKRVYVSGEMTEVLTLEQEEKRRRNKETKDLNTKVNLLTF